MNLALLKQGVIVRPVGNYGLPQWLRISIGLPEENEALHRGARKDATRRLTRALKGALFDDPWLRSFNKLVIFGVGLIGGSFALACAKAARRAARRWSARSARAQSLERALRTRASIDGALRRRRRAAEALRGADLVLLAAPVAQTGAAPRSASRRISTPHTIVTDAGSTKSDVVAARARRWASASRQFVPGHPIAGRESNGAGCRDCPICTAARRSC